MLIGVSVAWLTGLRGIYAGASERYMLTGSERRVHHTVYADKSEGYMLIGVRGVC